MIQLCTDLAHAFKPALCLSGGMSHAPLPLVNSLRYSRRLRRSYAFGSSLSSPDLCPHPTKFQPNPGSDIARGSNFER